MLKIEKLKKNYKEKQVLKDLNLHIQKNDIFALIGVNGAGKSTLVDIVCGLKPFDDGCIMINDIDIKDREQRQIVKKSVGYMPQIFSLFDDLTVRENLEYVSSLYGIEKSEINRVISVCYLDNYSNTLARNLSGGYKQLLSMASSIIHKPKLLILDEPTSAMDPLFRNKFWEIIKKVNKANTTILLITHYIEELLNCNKFACLSGGGIRHTGDVNEFKEKGFINIIEILNKFK